METDIFILNFENLFTLPGNVKVEKINVDNDIGYFIDWYFPYDRNKYIIGPHLHLALNQQKKVIDWYAALPQTHDEFMEECQEAFQKLFDDSENF